MTGVLFQFPERARLDRSLPKARIVAQARARGLRDRLSTQLADIRWAYKLAPTSLNLAASADVAEVQIFRLTLKPGIEDTDTIVLRAMDRAIPSPILFEIQGDKGIRMAAAWKRPNAADASKQVLDDYLQGDWLPADTPRQPLPVALDMAGLYRALLRTLIPLPARAGEALGEHLQRLAAVQAAERECARLQARLQRETQFNRKVEINRHLRQHTQQLAQLRRTTGAQETS